MDMNRVIFALCKHCRFAICLSPHDFTRQHMPIWEGRRYWAHVQLVEPPWHPAEPMQLDWRAIELTNEGYVVPW